MAHCVTTANIVCENTAQGHCLYSTPKKKKIEEPRNWSASTWPLTQWLDDKLRPFPGLHGWSKVVGKLSLSRDEEVQRPSV